MAKALRWLGPILDCSGYAAACRGYLRAADVAGLQIQARDRSRSVNLMNKGIDQPILDLYNRLSQTPVPKNCPTVQHTVPDVFVRDTRTILPIGYTIFEMSRVPTIWPAYCNQMSQIWTGSEYSKDAFVNSGVTVPVHVLPHAIDVDLYSNATPWTIKNRRQFAFLSIFDFTARKAWKDLLRAFWSAFSAEDDVCLILKVFFGDFSDDSRADIIRRIMNYRTELKLEDRAPILLYGHDVPGNDMPGLYKAADCYVGLSREGFGLSYAEAMAAGLACIGPQVGGTRQFMTPDNSFLVDYIGEEPISPELVKMFPSFEGLSWAKHSWEHLAAVMKRVVDDAHERKIVAEKGLETVKKELTYSVIGAKINALLPSEA